MFKTLSRTIILVIVFTFGSVVAASASVSDTNNQADAGETKQWNKNGSIHYYMKTFFGKWNGKWYTHYNKKSGEKDNKGQENPQPEQQEKPENPQQPEQQEKPDKNEIPEQHEVPEQNVENNGPTVEQQPEQEKPESVDALNNFEQQVFELTNQERANAGLATLQIDNELSRVAREKSRDMSINNYFSHDSPVYGSPFDMMRSYGINYQAAGENIAKGQRSPQEVVQAWMNSPGHRANILNSSFTHIGVGFVEQGNHWTQMFIRK